MFKIEIVIPWVLTVFFGLCTLYFSIKANKRAEANEVEKDSVAMASVMVKLDTISDDIKEIKVDNKAMRNEMNDFRERLAQNEASIKSFHDRLDRVEHKFVN